MVYNKKYRKRCEIEISKIEMGMDMANYKRIELLVKVAKLYYESDFSQEMIAKKLGLSRPYISKLLNEAKETGIVRVQVVDPLSVETALEQKVREQFHLKKVIVIPRSEEESSIQRLGTEAARYLDSIIKEGDVIGLSWGTTIHACAKALIQRQEFNNIVTVQLCGGVSNFSKSIYATEIANLFSIGLHSTSYVLPLPAVVDSKEMKELLQKDHNINRILQYGYDANIALFTMGAFGIKSALVHAGYIGPNAMDKLSEKGAVGDICSHVIDIHGNICDMELDERTVAIPLNVIRKKEYRIGVAQGSSKVDSILGALNGGIVNVLITNEDTAEWVLKRAGIE